MADDFVFAPPPFEPEAARATLVRQLRELKLVERQGVFEWQGCPIARVHLGEAERALQLDVAKAPSRSPTWERTTVRDHAVLRRFIDDLKKRLKAWEDHRDAS